MRHKLFFLLVFLLGNNIFTYSQEISEVEKLNEYDMISGPSVGYDGKESCQWKLYNIIKEKYSSEIIEQEYYYTNSIVSKIYLYWILREREWKNLSILYMDLMNYGDYTFWIYPFTPQMTVEWIIDFDYNITYEDYDNEEKYNIFEDSEQDHERRWNDLLKSYFDGILAPLKGYIESIDLSY